MPSKSLECVNSKNSKILIRRISDAVSCWETKTKTLFVINLWKMCMLINLFILSSNLYWEPYNSWDHLCFIRPCKITASSHKDLSILPPLVVLRSWEWVCTQPTAKQSRPSVYQEKKKSSYFSPAICIFTAWTPAWPEDKVANDGHMDCIWSCSTAGC